MQFLVIVIAYVIGSIPVGNGIVMAASRRESGRLAQGPISVTQAMRAAGLGAGFLTALLDGLKGGACVWLAHWILPPDTEATGMVLAGLSAIFGHSYSVFLRFRGSAGGAVAVGAAVAIWPWSIFVVLPVGLAILLGVGYASVATLSIAVAITALFAFRAYFQHTPSEFIFFGFGSLALLAWTLRGKIARLLQGQERLIGWRARRIKHAGTGESPPRGR
jgi:glycerol-3-phosphate acyltransferase PlsY